MTQLHELEDVRTGGSRSDDGPARKTTPATACTDPVNAAYSEFFDDMPPARVAVGVGALVRDVQVENDAVVVM